MDNTNEANFFVGDNFKKQLRVLMIFYKCSNIENKDLKLSIYPHLPDDKYQKEISPFAPSIFRYSLYFEKIKS